MSARSSLPVVWCADRNSADNKPTAFALQGIHLQGNISEQHVLAVRELINAASEGRLLLPADGGVVLLSCGGTGVGSLIVSSNESSNNNTKGASNNDDEDKKKFLEDCGSERHHRHQEHLQRPIFSNNTNNEVLYEFLCCARCMSEGTKCNNRATQNSKIIEKYLDAKINAGKAIRRASNHHNKPIKHRRKNKSSFKSENRTVIVKRVSNSLPIYATINKLEKLKNRENKVTSQTKKLSDVIESNAVNTLDQFSSSVIHESFRKTSFDSTCTISSMDSGFIEMQSKIELTKALNNGSSHRGVVGIIQQKAVSNINNESSTIHIKIDTPRESIDENLEQNVIKGEPLGTWNRLNVPQQSRNRRKSYEEFKSLFCDHNKLPLINYNNNININNEVSSLSKSRRKSYEEFKSVTNVICDNSSNNELTTIKNNLKSLNDENNANSTAGNFLTRMRRGSKRFSNNKKNSNAKNSIKKSNQDLSSGSGSANKECTIYDILRRRDVVEKNSIIEITNRKQFNYDKNLELFESHCNNDENSHKHSDDVFITNNNLKSCGTIYDILQNKSDMYAKGCSKKYDKYMTYGTIYEILHRKSDEGEQFDRKRTFSEKYINRQRINYDKKSTSSSPSSIKKKVAIIENNQNDLKSVTDTNDENLNSSSSAIIATSNSLKLGSCNSNNQLSITSVNSSTKQLSTIYDILQTKKLDTTAAAAVVSHQPSSKNRFLVRKITEEELIEQSQQKEGTKDRNTDVAGDIKDVKVNSSCNNHHDDHSSNKKQTKLRRFSNILSYSSNKINHNNNNNNQHLDAVDSATEIENISIDATQKLFPHVAIDDIYSRLNRTAHLKHIDNSASAIIAFEVENAVAINKGGMIYKSNSMDNILNVTSSEESQEFSMKQKQPFRKISVPAHLPPKILPKKSTRRLSEFTRGEFLNEKA